MNRYDFVLLIDVKDGNPNGDPDAGNLPRIDAETGQGLITDVCIKRKVRNYVSTLKEEKSPFCIYIKEKSILNKTNETAYAAIGKQKELEDTDKDNKKKSKDRMGVSVDEARMWMCKNFYDVRTFGAVMSTGVNCGQVRGPVQLTFARSVDGVDTQEFAVTRCAVTTENEAEKQKGDNRTIGRKSNIPYGLYVCHGFVSAFLAEQTGFNDDDLELLWNSLSGMFEIDRSAARGEMCTRGLYIFKHENKLGNAPAHKLFELISVKKISDGPARNFSDYEVTVNEESLPDGVSLIKRVE